MRRLVVATHNPKKSAEMERILGPALPEYEIVNLTAYPEAPEPEETGTTYAENALIKARSAAIVTGELCLADDAGLEVAALDGAPGLYSKRFGGEDLPFPRKIELLLSKLVGATDRSARFVCAVALVDGSGLEEVFLATCEGRICEEPHGGGGFGYDPVFFLPELGRTMAELTPYEKDSVSHRGKVLSQVMRHLRQA